MSRAGEYRFALRLAALEIRLYFVPIRQNSSENWAGSHRTRSSLPSSRVRGYGSGSTRAPLGCRKRSQIREFPILPCRSYEPKLRALCSASEDEVKGLGKKKVLGSSSLLGIMASVAERRHGWAAHVPARRLKS